MGKSGSGLSGRGHKAKRHVGELHCPSSFPLDVMQWRRDRVAQLLARNKPVTEGKEEK